MLRAELEDVQKERPDLIRLVRGKGLLNAVIIEEKDGKDAWDFCLKLKDNGLLAKPTHGDIVRLAPPLCITDAQIEESAAILRKTALEF